MTANRLPLLSALAALPLVSGLAAPYPTLAAQGDGDLSQFPLNLAAPVPPAFIMAVDDSGSMNWEMLVRNQDGEAIWGRDCNGCEWGFFEDDGSLRNGGYDPNGPGEPYGDFLELFPFPDRGTKREAIPPTTYFGFARSHEFNPAYYNPTPEVSYTPWKNADGTSWPDALATAAPVDPRDADGQKFDLTVDLKNATLQSWMFDFRTGMKIPAGTEYFERGDYANGNPNDGGGVRDSECSGVPGDRRAWRVADSEVTVDEACLIGIKYFPATYYLTTSTSPDGYIGTPLEILSSPGGPRNTALYRYEIRPGNYPSDGVAYRAAITKFANWFSYYRSRNLAMVAAMTHSLVDVNSLHVGYFTINSGARDCGGNCTAYDAYTDVEMRDMAVQTDRTALYAALMDLPAVGSTPNRWAVEHLGRQFQRTDANAPIQLACQRNAGMLFTDGYSNQGGPSVGSIDDAMNPPFEDNVADTMADTAAKYYLGAAEGGVAPLRSGSRFPTGKVPVPDGCEVTPPALPDPRLDCQADLHMNFYGITLGALGEMYGTPPYTGDSSEIDDIAHETPPVWKARQDDTPRAVDEIWHATLNARGRYINARTPAEITDAMREVLGAVGGGDTPSGSLALTGARVGEGSLIVTPSFKASNNGTDWSGELSAFEVGDDGVVADEPKWTASEELPPVDGREIFVANASVGVDPTVVPFTVEGLGDDVLDQLCSDDFARCRGSEIAALGVDATQVIAFLRGDESQEDPDGPLRARSTPLGDIVNSSPVISSPRDNYGYAALLDVAGTDVDPLDYSGYLEDKAPLDTLVYVGANDGMLHAFDGESGREKFAYIPRTALGHMGNLVFPYDPDDRTDQKFQHRYFVDGPITVSDAHWSGGWHTALVGTAGAGGRSVFALDVSAQGNFDGEDVLWEINDGADGAVGDRIGHVLGKPVIVPLRDGTNVRWVALFGNGYGSDSGQAALYVVDLDSGETTMIPVGDPGIGNGLGSIVVIDRWNDDTLGSDGYADTVYGGDLKGNLWKFDLRDESIAFGGQPLFTATDNAGNPQPITGGLEAATGPGTGVMLYFGTGSFSFEGDATDTALQTFYGVWDSGERITDGRNRLVRQNITSPAIEDGQALRATSGNPVNYLINKGWYLNLAIVGEDGGLTLSGERFLGTPRLQSGIVFFATFEPDSTDECATDGTNWLYGLDVLSGGAALNGLRVGAADAEPLEGSYGALKLNPADVGSSPVKDLAVVLTPGAEPLGSGATPEEIEAALERTCDMVIQPGDVFVARACGRQSWRQIR